MPRTARTLGAFLVAFCWTIGMGYADTRLVRIGESRFTLRHASLLSTRGGGDKGWQKTIDKAATLCSLLGYESMKIDSVHQRKQANEGFGTGSGATASTVECFAAENRPADAFDVADFDVDSPKTRRTVQAAIDSMLASEEKERKREEKLAARTPEEIAADEAKRQKELDAIKKKEQKALAKARKKLGKSDG